MFTLCERCIGMVVGLSVVAQVMVAHALPERYYQRQWCQQRGGEMEVRLKDRTRIDCLTDTHAVEVDFAPKWAEAVGQSLHYAQQSGRKPGILLLVKRGEERFVHTVREVIQYQHLPITLWILETSLP